MESADLSLKDIAVSAGLILFGVGAVRIAGTVERLEPKIKQGLEDFHAVQEKVEPFRETIDKAAQGIEKLTPFREADIQRRNR